MGAKVQRSLHQIRTGFPHRASSVGFLSRWWSGRASFLEQTISFAEPARRRTCYIQVFSQEALIRSRRLSNSEVTVKWSWSSELHLVRGESSLTLIIAVIRMLVGAAATGCRGRSA